MKLGDWCDRNFRWIYAVVVIGCFLLGYGLGHALQLASTS